MGEMKVAAKLGAEHKTIDACGEREREGGGRESERERVRERERESSEMQSGQI